MKDEAKTKKQLVAELEALRGIEVEHKQAETALREREERYRSTLEGMLEGFQIIDRDWRYVYLNDAAVVHSQRRREELLGHTMMDCYPGIEESSMFAALLRCMDERTPHRMENEFTYPDGSKTWFELSVQPVPEGISVLSLDITERKRAEEELRKSESRLKEAERIARIGSWELDLTANVLDWSDEVYRIFEIDPTQFGASYEAFLNLIHPEDRDSVNQAYTESVESKIPYEIVHRLLMPDGRVKFVREVCQTFYDVKGKPLRSVGTVQEITERKQAEDALQRSEDQLRQSQKMEAIGRLAGGIAHDFNNLLTAIMGYTQLALESLKEGDPLRRNIEEIAKAGGRAAELTRQLLAFSRRQVLVPQVVNLNQTVNDMENILRRIIGEDIDLLLSLEPILGTIKADPGQIEQVIMNLAVNARDAMPQGGKLTIETANVYLDEPYAGSHIAVEPGHYVMLAISDTGTGMDADTKAHIFEPFYTTKEEGTGLGLSTVYGIVKQSGGNIWLYSELGQGTTFKIYLPITEEPVEAIEPTALPSSLQGSETVLVVEDERVVRELVCTALDMNGYTVLEASNGGEALLICERHKGTIHLMLTDVVMPQMSGRDLAERLAPGHPEMKVLFMSGYTDNAIVRHGVLEPGIAFIQKPFVPNTLLRKVREVLDTPTTRQK